MGKFVTRDTIPFLRSTLLIKYLKSFHFFKMRDSYSSTVLFQSSLQTNKIQLNNSFISVLVQQHSANYKTSKKYPKLTATKLQTRMLNLFQDERFSQYKSVSLSQQQCHKRKNIRSAKDFWIT
jgi:hypothetical protein